MKNGFSLVELSIVLVVLGLLTGGILAGKSLIHAAELRNVGRDLAKYKAAVYSFQDKYFALPGDITNATSFWGIAAGTGSNSTCYNLQTDNPATCNGNGDGQIRYTDEAANSWEHLVRAGMIEGNYFGEFGIARTWIAGANIPTTGFSGIGIQYANRTAYQRTENYFIVAGDVYNITVLVGPAFLVEDAWNIDSKIDDGNASSGKLLAGNAFNGASYPTWCTTGWRIDSDAPGPTYNLTTSTSGNGCTLYYQPR